jgi:flagellar biosynthesis component FlhA
MSAPPSDRTSRTMALGLVGIVMMLIVPLPPVLLDVLLTSASPSDCWCSSSR